MKRILIIDDDPLILFALSKALREDDVEVKTVSTGNEAVARVKSCFYDLCILDLCLPDISGLTVMDLIKETSPETKIAIMTASYVDDFMKKAIDNAADFFFAKPFDLSEIRLLARSALETRAIHRKYKNYKGGF